MPTTLGATGQIMRSNAFTLTGNTQATQIVSMTGTSCMTDWLSIPCVTNLGRLSTPMTCIDRLCGGTFNSEPQNLNGSSIISEYTCVILWSSSFINLIFFKKNIYSTIFRKLRKYFFLWFFPLFSHVTARKLNYIKKL